MDFLNTVNFPNIFRFCKDLSKTTKRDFIERPELKSKIVAVLNKKNKNSALLIGDPGVGKSLFIQNLAKDMSNGFFNFVNLEKVIFKLDILALSAGIRQRIEIENRLKDLLEEVSQFKQVILFIDDIHSLFQIDSIHLPNILNKFIAECDCQCIVATTFDDYHKYFENSNKYLADKFEIIKVEPSTLEETENILQSIKKSYEDYYSIVFSDEMIKRCIQLADKYLIDKNFPRKAIDLFDEVGAYIFSRNNILTQDMQDCSDQISDAKSKQIENAMGLDFRKAIVYRDSALFYTNQLNSLKRQQREFKKGRKTDVTEEDIVHVISKNTGIPEARILQKGNQDLVDVTNKLKKEIIGQDEAIDIVANSIFKSFCGFSNENHPIGVFLFLGPTGVGKTELARLLSNALFKNKEAFIQVNMNEYLERHDIYKLIGSPPGYVGYQDGGFLLKKVKKNCHGLILFDEIEKANREIHKVLLQIMDTGKTMDVNGNVVDFRNTIIVMTSNIGFNLEDLRKVGFENRENDLNDEQKLNNELLKYFSLEFVNRIDETIVFNSLSKEVILKIVDSKLDKLRANIEGMSLHIEFTDRLRNFLCEKCYNPLYGARFVQRVFSRYLEVFLYNQVTSRKYKAGTTLEVDIENGAPFVSKVESPKAQEKEQSQDEKQEG